MLFIEQTTDKKEFRLVQKGFKKLLNTYLLTPILPNVLVRDISGLIQALSFLC